MSLSTDDKRGRFKDLRNDRMYASKFVPRNVEFNEDGEQVVTDADEAQRERYEEFNRERELEREREEKEQRSAGKLDDESKQRGEAVIAALAKPRRIPGGGKGGAAGAENEYSLDFLAEVNADNDHYIPRYLVNPLTYGNHDTLDFGPIFGYDIDTNEPMTRIWRMEEWDPIEIEPAQYGQFYEADCYLILQVNDTDTKLEVNVHHWHGPKTTTDKSGAVAIRAIELNMHLGGHCRVYREVGEQESDKFLSYFQGNLEYLFGGTPPIFRVLGERTYESRLYQVQRLPGRRIYVKLVEHAASSLQKSDVFILDTGLRIFLWLGSRSHPMARQKALELCIGINNIERGGNARVVRLNEEETDELLAYELQVFWNHLGGKPVVLRESEEVPTEFSWSHGGLAVLLTGTWDDWKNTIPLVESGEGEFTTTVPLPPGHYEYRFKVATEDGIKWDDELLDDVKNKIEVVAGGNVETTLRLYRTGPDENGQMRLHQVRERPLTKEMLETTHGYILDCETEIFVWLGRRASVIEKRLAKALGQKFLQFARPSWAPVVHIYESAETISFRSKFDYWDADVLPPADLTTAYKLFRSCAATSPQPEIDMKRLLKAKEKDQRMVDDGSSSCEIWIIIGPGPRFAKLPPEEKGFFFNAEAYMCLYTYFNYNKTEGIYEQKYIAYFWQGRYAANYWWSSFMFGFFPVLEKKLRKPVKPVRVFQQQEPEHFLAVFNGLMIVRKGKRGLKVTRSGIGKYETALFDVRMFSNIRTMAVEVDATSQSLHARDSFLLFTEDALYVWYGSQSKKRETEAAQRIAKMLKGRRLVYEFKEGSESGYDAKAFWKALGGEGGYSRNFEMDPRLYHFSNSSGGQLRLNPVWNFTQTDLAVHPEGCFILDAYTDIMLWIGPNACESLRQLALQKAKEFRRVVSRKRKIKCKVHEVEAGKEDQKFYRNFYAWLPEAEEAEDREKDAFEKQLERQHTLEVKRVFDWLLSEKERRRELFARLNEQGPALRINWRKALGIPEEDEKKDDDEDEIDIGDGKTTIEFKDTDAMAIQLFGSWDDFKEGKPMISKGDSTFGVVLELEPGEYKYRFKVVTLEGEVEWKHDPDRDFFKERSGYRNNILEVLDEEGRRKKAEKLRARRERERLRKERDAEKTNREEERRIRREKRERERAEEEAKKVAARRKKHGLDGGKERKVGADAKKVLFKWPHNGDKVSLRGSWDVFETEHKMEKSGGEWQCKVELDPGRYRYHFMVDGEARHDEDITSIKSSMYGRNNILKVE